eukprot:243316-Alexandrium_andersonii.AAC.1
MSGGQGTVRRRTLSEEREHSVEATGDESVARRHYSSEGATRTGCHWVECAIPAGSRRADVA